MGEQTVKKHKFKKWRKPGIRMQVLLGFVLFTAAVDISDHTAQHIL